MSKKALVIAAILMLLLLLIGGIAIVLLLNRNATNTPNQNTTNTTNTETNNNTNNNQSTDEANDAAVEAEASISDFLTSGENKRCTYVDGSDSGTMYFAGGNMRADFVSSEGNGSMIITQSKQYIWDNEEKAGVMFNVDASDTDLSEDYGGMDVNQNFTFNCTNWNVDASMFMPPSDVTMTDFSELFNY
jgi:hypothetical protein